MINSPSALVLKLSKFISGFFNPMNSLLIYFIIFSFKNHTLLQSAKNFIPILLITIIPISLWIYLNVKSKKYSDADVSDRSQRKSLYFFIAGSMITYLVYIFLREDRIDWVLFFLLILLIVMQISNYFIKSSMHTALNIFVAALMLTLDPLLGLLWLVIALIVGLTRIILKRHTIAEVASGTLISVIISFIYLYIQIQ